VDYFILGKINFIIYIIKMLKYITKNKNYVQKCFIIKKIFFSGSPPVDQPAAIHGARPVLRSYGRQNLHLVDP
jgi:hypothetical protein